MLLVIGGIDIPVVKGGAESVSLELGVRVREGDAVTVSVAVWVAVSVTVCGRGRGNEGVVDGVVVVDCAGSAWRV